MPETLQIHRSKESQPIHRVTNWAAICPEADSGFLIYRSRPEKSESIARVKIDHRRRTRMRQTFSEDHLATTFTSAFCVWSTRYG